MVTLLRPMAPGDVSTVLAIEIESNPLPWKEADFLAFLPTSALSVAPGVEAPPGQQKKGWVCVDPAVRGFACVVGVQPQDGSPGEAELQSIAVAKKFWGQGMGAALLQEAIAWTRAAGHRVLHLEVRESNERALALYRRLGFAQTGRRPRYYQDTGEAALLMSKET
jgi:ribosomal-protein-alanine N-acetyltransferase